MKKNEYLKLCLITHLESKTFDEYKKIILAAIRGGVTSIQLREKNLSFKELKLFALYISSLLKPFNIPLIINDHVRLAKEINADGVHLGQSDMSPIKARKILGKTKIIGISVESLQELHITNQLNCINYIAASAVFKSKTKTNCRTIWGLDGLKMISQQSVHPVIAIGGIDENNVNQIMENDACGIAVVSAIHDDPHPEISSAKLLQNINIKLLARNKSCLI